MTLFSMVMLFVAFRMLRQAISENAPSSRNPAYLEKNCMLDPSTGKLAWTLKCSSTLAAVGSLSGLLTGMLGLGGGFLIVPAFKQFSDVGMHGIVATSLMVIALISASAVVGAVMHGAHVSATGWFFIVAAGVGMMAGRFASPHLPARLLQIGFALLASVVAVSLMIRTYSEVF